MKPETLPHYWANRFGFLLRKRLVDLFARHGHRVTAEEWAVLLILQDRGGLTATELSDRSLRDKTTVTRMIDRMAAKDLVERRADPSDRRRQRLYLTGAGRDLFARLVPLAERLIARSLDGIAGDEVAVAVSVLSRMTANLSDEEREIEDGL